MHFDSLCFSAWVVAKDTMTDPVFFRLFEEKVSHGGTESTEAERLRCGEKRERWEEKGCIGRFCSFAVGGLAFHDGNHGFRLSVI